MRKAFQTLRYDCLPGFLADFGEVLLQAHRRSSDGEDEHSDGHPLIVSKVSVNKGSLHAGLIKLNSVLCRTFE